jgi:FMN hydrolase / 5-amino-6-(5-phospho-D-ribitylamino)uracil phosphatase
MTAQAIDWPNIDVLSFDLDDTLWPNPPVIQSANHAMLNKLHELVPRTKQLLPSTQLKQWHQQFFNSVVGIDFDLNQKRLKAIANYLSAIDEPDPDNMIAGQVFDAFFRARQCVKLYDDVLLALEQLSKRFRLVSLTNGNADMNQINGHHFFESHYTAAQFAVAKPDPRIYRKLLTAVNCPAARLAHIGDSLTMDVEPAQKIGINGIWLDRQSNSFANESEANQVNVQPKLTVNTLTELAELTASVAELKE